MATERIRRAVTQSLRVLSLKAVLTMFFLLIIMGATDSRAPHGFAPIAIGLGLTLIHLVGIPVTNLSVNPARSTAPALFVGGWALRELWMFWVAPLLGGALGGALYTILFSEVKLSAPISVGAPTIPRSKAEA
jgi:aquaporin Z